MMRYHRIQPQHLNSIAHSGAETLSKARQATAVYKETNNGKPPTQDINCILITSWDCVVIPNKITSIICNEFGIPISQQTIYLSKADLKWGHFLLIFLLRFTGIIPAFLFCFNL